MSLHSMCLGPVEGACLDRSTDPIWKSGIETMTKAVEEVGNRLVGTVDDLVNFVERIRGEDLKEIVLKNPSDNQALANAIHDYLNELQQEFFNIQVFAGESDQMSNPRELARQGCAPGIEFCPTEKGRTGHFWFDNVEGKGISVRYRVKTLPPTPDQFVQGLVDTPFIMFPDFYKAIADRITDVATLISFGECNDEHQAIACQVPLCFGCDATQQAAFDGQAGNYLVRRLEFDPFTLAESQQDTFGAFPSFDYRFMNGVGGPFRFHYGGH
jgi:hypothetical protein